MKRIYRFQALLMVIILIAVSIFTEVGASGISVREDSTSYDYNVNITGNNTVTVGETASYIFTVTGITQSKNGLAGIDVYIKYDTDVFSYVSYEIIAMPASWASGVSMRDEDRDGISDIYIAAFDESLSASIKNDGLVSVKLNFSVKTTSKTSASFTFIKLKGGCGDLSPATGNGYNKTVTVQSGAQSNAPEPPDAPEAVTITQTEVVLREFKGLEYSIDGITWQKSGTFTGLKPFTKYSFFQRYEKTLTNSESGPSQAYTVTTKCDHSEVAEYTFKAPTCKEPGEKKTSCLKCGEIVKTESIAMTGHQFGEWETVKAATETEPGQKKRVCSKCGEIEYGVIGVIGCSHANKSERRTEPGCLYDGEVKIFCTDCNELISSTVIKALGHSFEWIVTQEPTDTQNGMKEYICSRCGHIQSREVIPATGSGTAATGTTAEPGTQSTPGQTTVSTTTGAPVESTGGGSGKTGINTKTIIIIAVSASLVIVSAILIITIIRSKNRYR